MADLQAITMPKWGLAMEEGTVVAWLAEEGAAVEQGQEILEIETTKITNVFESPAAGTLIRRVVAEGDTLPVGALLGLVGPLDGAGVAESEIEAFVADFQESFATAAAEEAAAAPEPELVEAGGRQINLLRMGEGAGPPLVLVHGFGGDLNSWMFNQAVLAETRTVIALDLPGHGRSSKDVGSGEMGVLVGAVLDLLDSLGLESVHLAGHSMGGALSVALALKRLERVESLTLIGPGGMGPEINMDYIGGFVTASRRKELKALLALLVGDPALISRDMVEEVLKYKRLDGVEAALGAIAGQLFAGGRQGTFEAEELAAVGAPVQVIWGLEDKILPARQADALPPTFQVHRLEGIGHMPHMEAANEVNRLIADFVG